MKVLCYREHLEILPPEDVREYNKMKHLLMEKTPLCWDDGDYFVVADMKSSLYDILVLLAENFNVEIN